MTAKHEYTIEARQGYFQPSRKEAASLAETRRIDLAIMGNERLEQLPISVSTLSDKTLRGELAVWAAVHVDIGRLAFRSRNDRSVDELRFIAALFDSDDRFVTGKEGTIGLDLTKQSLETLSKEGVNGMFMLLAQPGKYRLRAVIEDPAQGAISAASLPVEIR
jgi:hypothetical protein